MKIETITLKKETANQLLLLIVNLINGKKPYYKKQKDALKILESKVVEFDHIKTELEKQKEL